MELHEMFTKKFITSREHCDFIRYLLSALARIVSILLMDTA